MNMRKRDLNQVRPAVVGLLEALEGRRLFATLTTFLDFAGTSDSGPLDHLIADTAGNLYGTTGGDGTNAHYGIVFKIPDGLTDKPGPLITLATFDGRNGRSLLGNLTLDEFGNLYGVTAYGGTHGIGTVFKIPRAVTDSPGPFVTLASFNFADDGNDNNGGEPYGTPTVDAAGNLYGTANIGGAIGYGNVFKIAGASTNSSGTITTLTSFNGPDGAYPFAGVIVDSTGNLYGTTEGNGNSNYGTVFKIPGGATDAPSPIITLATFDGTGGSHPIAGLTIDNAGNLYGTTFRKGENYEGGTVFKIPGGASEMPGSLVTLATFTGPNGQSPSTGSLIIDAAGNLYGTTSEGGAHEKGTAFTIPGAATNTPGALATLVSFDETNGAFTRSTLIVDTAGNLYGSGGGGIYHQGIIYKISDTGYVVDGTGTSEASVFGNGVEIADNDFRPTSADLTDFGSSLTRTFTVKNTGLGTLTTSNLRVNITNDPTGVKSTAYTVVEGLSPSIAPGASDSFTLRFSPTTAGTYTRYVYFDTNDADEGTYNFAIRAVEKPVAAEVRGNNIVIADGDVMPTSTDGTGFGRFERNATSIVRTFTLRNTGATTLNLSGPGIFFPGQSVETTLFDFVAPPPATLLAGQTATFSIRFSTSTVGTFTREVRFATTGAGLGVYSFHVTGTVVA